MDGDGAAARAIEFHEEDALPLPQVDLAGGDVERNRGSEQECAGVCVSVRLLSRRRRLAGGEVVVAVAGAAGRPALEGVLEVVEQQRLVLVDDDGGSRVSALHRDRAFSDPRPQYALGQERRQVHELEGLLRPQLDDVPADPQHRSLMHAHEDSRGHGSSS